MSIKEQLLAEAKTINVDVELDSIFESVELSDETKSKFSTVFESVVKQHAVALAEKHIADLGDMAEQLAEQKAVEKEAALVENVGKYFDHITSEWMAENKVAVDNDIKSNLFESLLGSLKVAFIEHNVSVPSESIDVVAELEQEIRESNDELNKTLDKLTEANKFITEMKRDAIFAESTKDLSEVQKEKARVLSESFTFSETYQNKLQSIVEMICAQGSNPVDDPNKSVITENLNYQENIEDDVLINEDKTKLAKKPSDDIDPNVSQYLNYK